MKAALLLAALILCTLDPTPRSSSEAIPTVEGAITSGTLLATTGAPDVRQEGYLRGGSAVPVTGRSAGVPHSLSGLVTWYCKPYRSACTRGYWWGGMYAAAGRRIRAALGPHWRGRYVTVSRNGRSVRVRLIDSCACGSRLLDLYSSAFRRLAPLSSGVLRVRVTW